jgi:hypothetical protein
MDKEKIADGTTSPTKPTPDSGRRFARHRADVPLAATVLAQDGYQRFEGRCSEIAVAGLGAVISTTLVVGEIVSLEICLPSPLQNLKLRAVVRRRNGLFHGFEFLELQAEQRELILAFCQGQKQA